MKDTVCEVAVKSLDYSNYFLWSYIQSQNFPHSLAMCTIKSLLEVDEIKVDG